MIIPKSILREARKSKWLEGGAWRELKVRDCDKPYQVFERILVNLAAEVRMSWREMYNCRPTRVEAYKQLVVAAVLIDRRLDYQFKMYPGDREALLGPVLSEIVRQYNRCLMEMK